MATQAPQFSPSGGNGSRSGDYVYNNGTWAYSPIGGGGGGGGSSWGGGGSNNQNQPTYGNAPSSNQAILDALNADPRFSGMDINAIYNAYLTGEWDGVTTGSGMPLDRTTADKAFNDSMSVLDPAYRQEKEKETADFESTLSAKKAGYDNYLSTSAANFESDKAQQDKTAADNGVLFSGGRYQKLQNLGSQYASDAALKKAQYGADISSLGRDYQYKYGNDAANSNNLSQYYRAGGNTYNPNVASGGVGSSGLSSVYNPNSLDLYGTNRSKQSAEAKQRAAGLLWNRGNKLVPGGYNNQY